MQYFPESLDHLNQLQGKAYTAELQKFELGIDTIARYTSIKASTQVPHAGCLLWMCSSSPLHASSSRSRTFSKPEGPP